MQAQGRGGDQEEGRRNEEVQAALVPLWGV